MPRTQPGPGGDAGKRFRVASWIDALGWTVERHPKAWMRLAERETALLQDRLNGIAVEHPIYVTGLARAGSTILLESLARHRLTATHRYRDYPPVLTPYLWNRLLERMPLQAEQAQERAHKDGILVTSESPEAFEEVLWMAAFPWLHDAGRSNVLDAGTENAAFERFYRDHIRKLLLVRGGERYLAKGNYNVTRIEYLLKLFPDARFVIPVRDPLWHVASLMKQHALFLDGQQGNPRARRHLRRVGHFEFGLDRRPINLGDDGAAARVMRLWADGREVEGWALYWSQVYGYLADLLDASAAVRAAALVVRFEDLCSAPRQTLETVLRHCGLPATADFLDAIAGPIRFPTYYAPSFDAEETDSIQQLTQATSARFGYGPAGEDGRAGRAAAAAGGPGRGAGAATIFRSSA